MAKVLLWNYNPAYAELIRNLLVEAGHKVVVAADTSNLGPIAKTEEQAGTPIEVVIVEVNHDFIRGQALNGIHCAKEIRSQPKIIALCCCTDGINEAANARCTEAFLKDQYYILPLVISHVLQTV